jgi:hypothetical protein
MCHIKSLNGLRVAKLVPSMTPFGFRSIHEQILCHTLEQDFSVNRILPLFPHSVSDKTVANFERGLMDSRGLGVLGDVDNIDTEKTQTDSPYRNKHF